MTHRMLTNRARHLAAMGLLGLVLGAFRGQAVLSLISFAVLLWIVSEWFRFLTRLRFQLPRVQFERLVNDRADSRGTLWVGRQVRIRLRAWSPSRLKLQMTLRDVVPEILAIAAETPTSVAPRRSFRDLGMRIRHWFVPPKIATSPNQGEWPSGATETIINYETSVRAAGSVTFPGIRVTVHGDFGLFESHRFVELTQHFRLLPNYSDSGELRPSVKRHNSLPRHGIHRLQRSGMGSELLELRDYVAGDPPKAIAWKVSARRDKLLTRQYESEVPVRVQLIVDGSDSTRVGGYGLRLIDQMNFAAASIARAAIAVGDPVGGMLIDETTSRNLPWLSGDRGFLDLLKALADFSQMSLPSTQVITPTMMARATSICHERYPELLDARYNQPPLALRPSTRRRYRIAGVMAEVFQLSAAQHVNCICDDRLMARYLCEFLLREGRPWMTPTTPTGDPAVASARRMQLIADSLLKRISHARDNEVFVVFADLLSCAPNLPELTRIVKLARAKHHRMAFICPTTTFIRPRQEKIIPKSESVLDLMLAAEQSRIRDLALHMQRELVRLGAAVSFTGQPSAIQMVIAEMDLARDGRGRPQGVRG